METEWCAMASTFKGRSPNQISRCSSNLCWKILKRPRKRPKPKIKCNAEKPLLSEDNGNNRNMLDFDAALEEIGEFGRFQIVNYLLFCLPLFFSAGNSLTYVFTAGKVNHRCFIDGCDDEKTPLYNATWLENAIPSKGSVAEPYEAAQCQHYVKRNISSNTVCGADGFTKDVTTCTRWVFEDNERTISQEWNITCPENQWKLSLVGTVHFLGIFFGTVLFGYLADRYGRKLVFIFCILLMSITGIAQAVCQDYITFQVFVFLNALGTSGVYPLAFILGVELVGRKKREMSGVVLNYFYAIGEATVGLVAWLSKDWVTIQLAVSVPPALFIFYYWLVPESVRWLIAKRDNKKAGIIMKQAAKMNGVTLSKHLLNTIENEKNGDSSMEVKDEAPTVWLTFKQLIRSPTLCIRSIILFYIWAANAFVYYGLSVNSTTLGGNKYLNFAFVCLVEIPGYTLSWIMMNKLGRRWSFAGSMLFCGATCIAAAFVPTDTNWAIVTLFLLGKLGITSSFGIAYVYTAEVYPTIMRSVGVGLCSMMARLGAIIAPFAPDLAVYSKPLPLLIFSCVALLAGVLALFLPETLGTKLPDTVQEAENFKLVRDTTPTQSDASSSEKESDNEQNGVI